MKPMLARTYNPATFSSFPCYIQPKLNGVRCLYSGGIFQSRDEKLFPSFLLAHVKRDLDTLKIPPGLILDGELYHHGWPLQRINGAMATNRNELSDDSKQIEYHIFDFVDTQRLTLDIKDRIDLISFNISPNDLQSIVPVKTTKVRSKEEVHKLFLEYTEQGYEGVVLRVPLIPYEVGEHPCLHDPSRLVEYRSKGLWKYKAWMDEEFLCVGTTDGLGKADIGIGALVCRLKDTIHPHEITFNVGSGFEDHERIYFKSYPPLGKKIKVKFIGYSADGLPLNPTFLCVMP